MTSPLGVGQLILALLYRIRPRKPSPDSSKMNESWDCPLVIVDGQWLADASYYRESDLVQLILRTDLS
jgi:hypothetical protein